MLHFYLEEKTTCKWDSIYEVEYAMNCLKISAKTTKVIAFSGKDPVRSIIVMNSKIIELNHFSYLGCDISCNYNRDVESKVSKY